MSEAAALIDRFSEVRKRTETLCAPLETEDYVIQAVPEASPAKWHLAHTSWFFERFILSDYEPGFRPHHPHYFYLFNSYYHSVGGQTLFPRPHRGTLSRPTVKEVYRYRSEIDSRILNCLSLKSSPEKQQRLLEILELGLNHEQQHQELLLTDILYNFSVNPLRPIAFQRDELPRASKIPLTWTRYDEGLRQIGHRGAAFSYDNETPRHQTYVQSFELASRLVTNEEFSEFIRDGGYTEPTLWLSDGWDWVRSNSISEPLHWRPPFSEEMTLHGARKIDPDAPVCHISYFEADAFARWKGARLPSEEEWEIAVETLPIEGQFADSDIFHPLTHSLFGSVWQWTKSAYSPYPGFRRAEGALGEYNAKFMCNQFVLRGGSCATPRSHFRVTYRNFFAPEARWQFTGIRLARD